MNINLSNLTSREREIIFSLSVLPVSYRSIPELLKIFQVDDNDSVGFFDTVHDLSNNGFISRNKDLYGLDSDTCSNILRKYKPTAEQCTTIIDYFSAKLETGKLDSEKEFLPFFQSLSSLLQNISGNTFHLAQLSYLLSTNLVKHKKYSEALNYNQRAIEIAESIDKKHPIVALYYREKASIYKKTDDTVNAIFYSLKDIEILEKNAGKYDNFLPHSYFLLSKTYEEIRNYEKAVEYNLKAINFEQKINQNKSLSISGLYHNLAYCYAKQKKIKDAILFLNKAMEAFIDEEQNNDKHYKLLLQDQKRFNQLLKFQQAILKSKKHILITTGLFLGVLIWTVYYLLK